ncbi:hypothetical protein [Streptomyces sp. NPDC056549]|uniref:hypothetical protein n=1 Tax=Streptomyces sp. NPDC056549 TaxID=3345864 RepID=UPI0036B1F019
MNTKRIRSYDALMQAFAVTEMVVASLPEVPSSIIMQDTDRQQGCTVRLYFHNAPEQVTDFGNRYGAPTEATTRPNSIRPSGPEAYTEATAVIDGVTVKAWSLTDTVAVTA